jgi:hypothetical protein
MVDDQNKTENSEEYENFTDFVKKILKVPKSDIDEITRQERAKEKEKNQDPLKKKQESN